MTLPCEIAGRIEKARDRDWYRFTAKKGERTASRSSATGSARRSTCTSHCGRTSRRTAGIRRQSGDPASAQFYTRTDDPQRYQLDGDGRRHVSAAGVEPRGRHPGGTAAPVPRAHHAEQPDFRLVVMPPSTYARMGVLLQTGTQAYTVLVWRHDGFNGDIALTPRDCRPA